ncbi:SMI1/KNR4 family protein [Paenibacillus chitinolyticus]|uniref:SMI1/KNR4 family protein n=1 Tax=Paenibacillus chitinolyticus TaxID=79263 RepID=UPI0035E3123D
MSIVEESLNGIKKIFKGNARLIQSREGYISSTECIFNEPASLETIETICKKKGWKLPSEYIDFLLITNGAKLFRDEYGTCWEFFSIDQAASIDYLPGLPANLIPIAFYIGDFIFIDTDKVDQGKEYLIFHDHEEAFNNPSYVFKIPFDIWLDRLFISQGTKFWTWNN